MASGMFGPPKGGPSIPTSDLDLPLSPLDALASQTRTVKLSIRREGRHANGSAGQRPGPEAEHPRERRSGEESPTLGAAPYFGGGAAPVVRPPAGARRSPAGPAPARLNLDNVSSLVASGWGSQPAAQHRPGPQDEMAGPAPFLGVSEDAADSPLGLSTAFQSQPRARAGRRAPSDHRKSSRDYRATRQSVMSFETDSTDYVWNEDDRSDLDGSSYTAGPASAASDHQPPGLLRRPSTGQVRGGMPARREDSEEKFRSVYAEQGDGEEVLHTAGLVPPLPQHPDRHTWMSSATGDTLQTETTTDNDGLRSKYDSGFSVGTEDPFEFAKYESPRPALPQPSSSYPNPALAASWTGPREEDYSPRLGPAAAGTPPSMPPQSRPRTQSASTAASSATTGVINYSRPLRIPSSPPPVPLPPPPAAYANEPPGWRQRQMSQNTSPPRHAFSAAVQPRGMGSAGPAVIVSGDVPSGPPPLPPPPPSTHELRSARSRGSVESQSSAGTKRSGSKGRLGGKKPSLFKRRGSSASRPEETPRGSADWIDLRHSMPSSPPTMTFTDAAVGQGKLKEPVEEEVDRRWREEEEMRRRAEEEEERARWDAYDRTQNAIGQTYQQQQQQQPWQGEASHQNYAAAYGGAYDDGLETAGQQRLGGGGHPGRPDYDPQHDRNPSQNSEELGRARYSLYSLPPDEQLAHYKRQSLRPLGQFLPGSGGATEADPRSAPGGGHARFAPNLAAPNRESRLPAAMAKTKAALYFRPDLNGSSGAGGAETAQDYVQLGIEAHERGDLDRSATLFERAAREYGGCVGGMLMWGLTLRHGWGVAVNQERGFKWLQKAAESVVEDLDQTRRAGGAAGRGAPGDETKAAKSELVLAIYELGQCFRRGWGCKKDKQLAISYFELAAKLGDADAQTELGFCYANGKGAKRDLKRAAKYYRMAAQQGVQTMGLQWIWKEKYND